MNEAILETSDTILDNSLAVLSPDNLGTVLSVGDFAGLPGTTVTVPIVISDAEDLQSLQLDLTYDTSILNIIDPDTSIDNGENEGVRRAGITAGWESTENNPVANVNEETGVVKIALSIPGNVQPPQLDEEGNVPSGTILEIDFEVDADAALGSIANIDLQSARVGVNDQDIPVGDDNLGDGSVAVGSGSTIQLFRFRNTTFDTGTYVFVGEQEKNDIQANPDFNQTFSLDGVQEDGSVNPAFIASTVPGDGLIPFFRLSSLAVPGTFLFVSTDEYNAIFAEDSDQRDQWDRQGFNEDGSEDIPEFYLYGVGAGAGTEFNRFQNNQNGTFLYAGPGETQSIENDPNFSNLFDNQGGAFESLG